MEACLIQPSHNEFGTPILSVRKVYCSLRMCIDYRGLNEVARKDAYPLPCVDDKPEGHKFLKDTDFMHARPTRIPESQ
jgi:hypothetical protein